MPIPSINSERKAINEPKTHFLIPVDRSPYPTGTLPIPVEASIVKKNLEDNPSLAPREWEIPTTPPEQTLPVAKPWVR